MREYQKAWRLANPEKKKAHNKAWRDANPTYTREWQKAHPEEFKQICTKWRKNNPEKAKAWDKRNPDKIKKQQKEYSQANKDKIRIRQRKHNQTPRGKLVKLKATSKRKRELGCNPFNEPILNMHGHHLDKINVIYIPKDLHNAYRHRQSNEKSMLRINILAWTYLESSSY